MILTVPDYYEAFACTAGWCKDSCCIGWEINIDEETVEYYESIPGEFGSRLKEAMYADEDGEISFRLGRKKRCPFLNGKNLCEVCIHLGEEALSEVCTEYPRFSLWYADVQQKCLSLSCEEAGRLLFAREEPISFVRREFSMEMEPMTEECEAQKEFFEQVQTQAIAILQNRSLSIEQRMQEYLSYLTWVQERINRFEVAEGEYPQLTFSQLDNSYEQYGKRMEIFDELEVLDEEWESVKAKMKEGFTENNYETLLCGFLENEAYEERDYEHLLVYFTFRYFMNAFYDMDVLSYGKMSVVFTRMVRDMDVLRFEENGKAFSRADRVDTARIFSKEVEHSEENVEYVREELLFF